MHSQRLEHAAIRCRHHSSARQGVWQFVATPYLPLALKSWMCRQRLGRSVAPVLLSCLPNRAFKVNSFLRFSSTLRTSAITDSLHRQRTHVITSRLRSAFTRRGPCVPSRSALWPSHALHQVRKQGCPSSFALSSPKGGSRQEIADIPRFAAPPGDAHRARGSLVSFLLNNAGACPQRLPGSPARRLLRRL